MKPVFPTIPFHCDSSENKSDSDHRSKWYLLTIGAFSFVSLFGVSLVVPWRSAVAFGADEGYEFTKAFLVHQGFSLYDPIWNDQPPLHTILTARAFDVFGPTASVSRFVALAFGWVYLFAVGMLVARCHGLVAGCLGVLCALCLPPTLELSISSMLELPAISVALLSTLVLTSGSVSLHRCFGFGLVMGVACQMKFTAVVMIPACLFWLGAQSLNCESTRGARSIIRHILASALGCMLSFGVVWACVPEMAWDLVWTTHFPTVELSGTNPFEGQRFSPWAFFQHHAFAVTVSLLSILYGISDRQLPVIPIGSLITALILHVFHQPYWYYYDLHFVFGLSWLCSAGLVRCAKGLSTPLRRCPPFVTPIRTLRLLLSVGLFGWFLVDGGQRFSRDLMRFRAAEKIEESILIKTLRQHGKESDFMYTQMRAQAFHAGIPLVPESAIIPQKRRWAHQFSDNELVAHLLIKRPQLLLLTQSQAESATFLDLLSNYSIISSNYWWALYREKPRGQSTPTQDY